MQTQTHEVKPITTRKSLIRHLHAAMQLEHATIPPYLTALYSIKPGTNPDAAQVLRVVAVEEMLHLVLTANLLNAVGGEPRLTDRSFVPEYPAFLPDGETDFQVHLQPFSRNAIETFLKIERPRNTPEDQPAVVPRTLGSEAGRTLLATHPDDENLRYYTIGEFYNAIEKGLILLEGEAARHKEENGKVGTIFTGPPDRQITKEYYYSGGGSIHPVVDLKSALSAIHLIIEQGEGETTNIFGHEEGELAHYFRFEQLKYGRYFQKSDDNGKPFPLPTGPKLEVDWDAVYPLKKDAKMSDYARGSEAEAAAATFNDAYRNFLGLLQRAFTGQPSLLIEGVPMMFELRNKVNQLVRNPLKSGSPFNAAPTFEVHALVEALA